jgi:hypothetical protein
VLCVIKLTCAVCEQKTDADHAEEEDEDDDEMVVALAEQKPKVNTDLAV